MNSIIENIFKSSFLINLFRDINIAHIFYVKLGMHTPVI
jgi:hypothetical protein